MQCGRLYVQRTVELLALPLVCHLVGITNGSHPMHNAFIEPGSKPFPRLHVIYLHLHCWHECCSHPACVIGEEENPPGCSKLFPWYGLSPLEPRDCIRDFPLLSWKNFDANLPLDLQSVGHFLLPQVQLRNKRVSGLVQPNSARHFS